MSNLKNYGVKTEIDGITWYITDCCYCPYSKGELHMYCSKLRKTIRTDSRIYEKCPLTKIYGNE